MNSSGGRRMKSINNSLLLNMLNSQCDNDDEEREYLAVKLKLLSFVMSTVGNYMSSHSTELSSTEAWPVRELIENFPSVAKALDQDDWFPLHWAAAAGQVISPLDCSVILQKYPSSCRDASNTPSRLLPIHVLSCQIEPNMDFAKDLVTAYPFCAMQVDSAGFLPLHFAALYTKSIPYLKFLLQANSKGLYQPTNHRQNCLHFAVDNPNDEILELLLSVWPEGSGEQVQSKDAESPFFYAIKRGNGAAVQAMLSCDPSLAWRQNSKHQFPLHYAAKNSNLDVVSCLLTASPNMTCVASGHKNSFPLHQAVLNPFDDVYSFLLAHTPMTPPLEFVMAQRHPPQEMEDQGGSTAASTTSTVVPPALPASSVDHVYAIATWLRDSDSMHPIHSLMKSDQLTKSRLQLFLKKLVTHYTSVLSRSVWSKRLNPVVYAQSFLFLMTDNDGNTPLHLFINSVLNIKNSHSTHFQECFSAEKMNILECLLKNAPEACLVVNNVTSELPIHRFAYVIDKILGCCCRVPTSKCSTPTNRGNEKRIRCDHACEVMRLLLKHIKMIPNSSRLPSHLEASLEIIGSDIFDTDVSRAADISSNQRGFPLSIIDNSFLLEDIDMSSFNDVVDINGGGHVGMSVRNVSSQQSVNTTVLPSILEHCNIAGENVYDLLTRSSIQVNISHNLSISGEDLYTTDGDEDVLLYCNVPTHQMEEMQSVAEESVPSTRFRSYDDSSSDRLGRFSFEFDSTSSGVRSTTGRSGDQLCTRGHLKRLILLAHPGFNKPLLHELNYRSRRMALFLGFCAGSIATPGNKREVNIFAKLARIGHGELFMTVVKYL